MAVAPSCVAETVVNPPLNYTLLLRMYLDEPRVLTTPVGVLEAEIMYASLTSLRAGRDVLNCLCIEARRCCGREAILKDVRRAVDILNSS